MTLSNNQTRFWQWDTNQKIKVDGAAKELHYIGIDGAVEVDGDGWAAVPDELLQNSGTILGWAYLTDHTIERFTVGVSPRSKPPDYVYTPTEVKTWTELEEKIRELEEKSRAGQMQLVKTVTLSAPAASITVTEPVAAFEAMLEVPVATAAASCGIEVHNNAGVVGYAWAGGLISDSTARYCKIFLRNSGGVYHFGTVSGSNTTRAETQQEGVSVITDENLPVTKISIYSSGTGTMPAGTKLTLYGIPGND